MDENKNHFKNSSLNLSVFLIAKGMQLVGIEKHQFSNKATFIFSNNLRCEQLTQIFNFAKANDPETLIDARKLLVELKNLKDRLYQATKYETEQQ